MCLRFFMLDLWRLDCHSKTMKSETTLRQFIRRELEEQAEEKYRIFSSSLLPEVHNMLGVRLPYLRKMARRLVKEEGWRVWLDDALTSPTAGEYFEEIMLQGMVIGCAKFEGEAASQWRQRAELVRSFVPKIDNWSVCDSFCVGLAALAEDKRALKEFLTPYVASVREFEVRFAVVMMLDHFTDSADLPWLLDNLNNARHSGWYARMGTAWALSVLYVRWPEQVWSYLTADQPDAEILALALRKILESRRVTGEERERVRCLRDKMKKRVAAK